MIRMGLALTIFVIVMNAILLGTNTPGYTDLGAFKDLSDALNRFQNVGAETEIGFEPTTILGSPGTLPDFLGFVSAITSAAIAAIKLAIVLLAGSVQVIALLDPNNLWGLVILGPIAAIQIFYFLFLILTIGATLLGSKS